MNIDFSLFDEEIEREIARRSLHEFIQYINPEYITSHFSQTVCDALDQFLVDMMDGKRPKLILGAPPQHGKSDIVSRYLPAYFFGKYPNMRVGALSYSSDLAGDMNTDVQRIMMSAEYRVLFPKSWLGNKPENGIAVKRNSDEFGLMNEPNLPAYETASKKWKGGTFADITQDITDMFSRIEMSSGGIIKDDIAVFYVPAMLSAAAATLAATWPILAIIAVIALLAAAFALVYDDIMNFIDGNDSMIGRILDEYPELKAVIIALWEAFKAFFDFVIALSQVVADVAVSAFNFIVDGGKQLWVWLSGFIRDLADWGKQFEGVFTVASDAVVGIFKWLWAQIKQYLGWINDGLEAIKNGWSTVKGWFGFEDAQVTQTVERKITTDGTIEHQIPEQPKLSGEDTALLVKGLSQQINGMSANPINPMTSQAISNQSSTTNETNLSIGEIKVETQATDAQGMANGTKDALQSQLQDLGHQTSSGMKA